MLLPGDVVAFAFNALGPDGVTRINTLAYLEKAGASILTNVESITPRELNLIAGTAAPPTAPSVPAVLIVAAAILLTLLSLSVFLVWGGRSSSI